MKVRADSRPLSRAVWMHLLTLLLTMYLVLSLVLRLAVLRGMSDSYVDGLEIAESCFTVFFILEMIVKLGALGVGEYCSDSWNLMDGCIVIIGIVSILVTIGLSLTLRSSLHQCVWL